MHVTWVNKTFLDYRVPVYAELDRLLDGQLTLVYSADHTPERVQRKITAALGKRAIALSGESVLFRRGNFSSDFANASVEVTWQSGLFNQITCSRPDVLIGEGFFKWTSAALLYRIRYGTPLVISYERTLHTERHSQWYRSAFRKAVLCLTNAVCCNGRLSAEYVETLGLRREFIVTGCMAADSESLQLQCDSIPATLRTEFRTANKLTTPVFLYVGQLVERKGVRQLLEGWIQFQKQRGPSCGSLVLVGDGPERQSLETMVAAEGLTGVHFIGAIDYDSIAAWYAAADIFVMPTLEDNWSLVVPEAMACGLPVLCSVFNGCWPELVHSGKNGFTFDPYSPQDIAAKLGHFIDHSEDLTSFSQESKTLASEYSPKKAAQSILDACLIAIDPAAVANKKSRNKKKRLAVITNIPTPYRVDLYKELSNSDKIESKVFFCAEREKNRMWTIDSMLGYPHEFISGLTIDHENGAATYVSINLITRLKQFKPDIIISGGSSVPSLLAILYSRFSGCQVYLWWAGTILSEGSRGFWVRFYRKWMFNKVDGILAYSKQCQEYLHSLSIKDTKILVIGNNTLNSETYILPTDAGHESARCNEETTLLYVGQLILRKNVIALLEAYRSLIVKYPALKLIVAGSGSAEKSLKQFCTTHALSGATFLGNVQPDELKAIYRQSNLVVNPAIMDQWPQTINEAMSSGIPVIATTTSGVDDDFIIDGINGFLVEPADVKALASRIEYLITNPEQARIMGEKALEVSRSRDVHIVVRHVEAICTRET